jgi:hypothetical protein
MNGISRIADNEGYAVKKRVALIALVAVFIAGSAALRGCQDPTKPIPWVSDLPASTSSPLPRPATS